LFLLLLFWLPSSKFWFHALFALSAFWEELQQASDAEPPNRMSRDVQMRREPSRRMLLCRHEWRPLCRF
jgi:hypothetical protein